MEITVLVMAVILLYAAIKQHKLLNLLADLEDKLMKIMERDVEKW
jgi:hypothetical protein